MKNAEILFICIYRLFLILTVNVPIAIGIQLL